MNSSSKLKKQFLNLITIWLVLFSGCDSEKELSIPKPPEDVSLSNSIYYHIDLNNQTDDRFHVIGYMSGLLVDNAIYQFPAVVPGTYRISDMGRFVHDFSAYNDQNQIIESRQISTNQWLISDPEEVNYITYEVSDTWDTPVPTNPLFRMSGTSLERDHALLNTFGILGYPTGLKERNYYLSLDYPENWTVGSSLQENRENLFWAKNYDDFVDSPILAGEITNSEIKIADTEIAIYSFSRTRQISSSDLIKEIESVLFDAKAFLKVLPVDRYSFLFHFDVLMIGALEHSFSSVYTLQETTLSPNYIQLIKSITAHEFFHIVTPLNIRSEIIQDFNFADPTPSAHLWLYEGVTEWASLLMQYRNQSLGLGDLLDELTGKINLSERFDSTMSLEQISLKSFTPEGRSQFANIYLRGAMTALLLDIRLLELSEGTYGLRELILELIDIYGPDNAFVDDQFFDQLVVITYPEISDFFDRYIKGTEPLPFKSYFEKVGISYDQDTNELSPFPILSTEQQKLFNKWKVNF